MICAAMEYAGSRQGAVFAAIDETIRANTEEVLADAARRGVLASQAAVELASRKVEAAMKTRRWSIF